jgi:hypothetical protein
VKRLLIATAALAAAVVLFVVLALPPRSLHLPDSSPDGTVPGVLHVHSARSDGRSTPEEIAEEAARAGLTFVVLTDHGDATRKPDPPYYHAGVLMLDGVEISTTGGHYIAIDMPAAPYPLGGEARDVVEDVKRLGGFGIAAHPDSPKPELRWREWSAPFDGVEILNPDTSWRQQMAGQWRGRLTLAKTLMVYSFRAPESIASLLQPSGVVSEWTDLAERRAVVLVAGVDAHGKVSLKGDPEQARASLAFPSYEASFRVLSIRVKPNRPLTGDAALDAALVVKAIRAGHLYTVVDGVAGPPSFELTATNGAGTAGPGDLLPVNGPLMLRIRTNAPPEFTTTVRNGARTVSSDHHEREFSVRLPEGPGAFWVEVRATPQMAAVPWLTSNPIYVRAAEPADVPPAAKPVTSSRALFDGRTASDWHVEHDPTSLVALDLASKEAKSSELRLRFGLSGGTAAGQYAALVRDTPAGVAAFDRVSFTLRAERPFRLSVQLRAGVERWQRSVYGDATDQERTVYFRDMTPVADTNTRLPPLERIGSLLFVVDTTNTKPGASGRLWITKVALLK